jgi:hypothetical protein
MESTNIDIERLNAEKVQGETVLKEMYNEEGMAPYMHPSNCVKIEVFSFIRVASSRIGSREKPFKSRVLSFKARVLSFK